MKKIELLFSDVSFGTHEFGFLPRKLGPGDAEDAGDSEDARYRKHLARMGIEARVVGGVVRIPA
jgi:hypothetical protein